MPENSINDEQDINDEAARQFAQEIIAKCESLSLGQSVTLEADTEITRRAIPIIDAYFDISDEGRFSSKEDYMILYSGKGRIQKRYQMNLKTVYYDNFF